MRDGARLGNELDQLVPTIIEMDLGRVDVEFDQDPDGCLCVIGTALAKCHRT